MCLERSRRKEGNPPCDGSSSGHLPRSIGADRSWERDAGMDGPLRGWHQAEPLLLLWIETCCFSGTPLGKILFFFFNVALLLTGAEQHAFDVSVWPENPVVEHRGSLWLNCSTSCREADARGGLETSLIWERRDNGSNWASFQLANITEWASAPECFFICDGERKATSANITVYRLPELVELDPVPAMEVGENYTFTCRVSSIAPIRNLSVTFLQGGKKLHTWTFEKHAEHEAGDVVVNHAVTARRTDHGEEISCSAALDLRPEGPLFEKASLNQLLKTVAFPTGPRLQIPPYVEADDDMAVTCDVVGVFPANQAEFDLTFMGTGLNVNVTVSGDTARAQAQVSLSNIGEEKLNCTVSLGPMVKSAVGSVNVYSFPEPSLEIRPSQVLANNPVAVTCDSPATQPPNVSLLIKNYLGRILASGDHLPLQLHLTAQEEDDGMEFVCEAELAVGGNTVTKRASANLTVFYVPKMDESTCPGNRTWVEGTRQRLRCTAKGNPEPSVACMKDGVAQAVDEEEEVARTHGGLYNCTATSGLGTTSRTVVVHVEYGPQLDESRCPSSQIWVEGRLQQLNCQADGMPVPEVSCTKDGEVYDTGKLQNITQSHAGVYHCNATNAHGSRGKIVTVKVEYGPAMDDSSCPDNWTWRGGTEQALVCSAKGSPEPVVECAKDGAAFHLGVLQHITKEHAGTYRCTATNVHGSVARDVTIHVEYEPEMDESNCPSNWTLVEGALPAFACKAEGVPPPTVICTKDGVSYPLSQGEGIPADSGIFWCNATNRHGTAAKSVTVVVETKPKMEESRCPSNQTWLEGTLRSVACEADGTPTPLVLCFKEGATEEFHQEQNISRNDSGVYQCEATNGHGTDRWTVTVQVEYRPTISLLAVSASLPIRRGTSFNVTCQADGSPPAVYTWRVPPASNLNYAGSNNVVTITGAGGQNSGVYECTASNKHGQHLSQVEIQVKDHWLYIIVVVAIASAAMLVLGGMAGVIYYLKSTACKKGEYNVRDAENSTEATCLNRERACDGDIYGIQLTRT
uniref:intercellular adhesion molecule 5-like n=1 Tax=Euleptes europaea TaxID=460621 RepID=UPI00254031C8|nr:intercellular adhesion molecule 5-like [Euleptes europaea]